MDVINFSGGEPEIEPSRDIVALALDAAAAAGVVPVVAAGNDYEDVGAGLRLVTGQLGAGDRVGAADMAAPDDAHARGLLVRRADDDLAAPQAGRLRARRRRALLGLGRRLGRALRDEHGVAARRGRARRSSASGIPAWSVEQIKSALVQSGIDVRRTRSRAAGPRFQGGGVVALDGQTHRSSSPTRPRSRSGCSRAGESRPRRSPSTDAGGGAGTWQVEPGSDDPSGGAKLALAGDGRRCRASSPWPVTVGADARVGDLDGYVELRRGARRATGAGLGPRRPPRRSPGTRRSLSSDPASTAARRAGQPAYRLPLPLSGDAARHRRHDDAARAGAGLPAADLEARRELRRRRHERAAPEATSSRGSCRGSTKTA